MTILDEIVRIVPTLSSDEQRRVLQVATELRDARGLRDVTLPAADAGDEAWDAWSERVRARSSGIMAGEKRRLAALGILDDHGDVLTDELPDDMRPSSKTSVET